MVHDLFLQTASGKLKNYLDNQRFINKVGFNLI
jgi:hypothetical protein